MHFEDGVAYPVKGSGGFDPQQPFFSLFHFPLPAINRHDLGNDVDAGGELVVDQCFRDPARFIDGAGGCHDDSLVGHIKSAFSSKTTIFETVISETLAIAEQFVKVDSPHS